MSCLDGSEIRRYVQGTLNDALADSATRHLVTCKRCRQAVAELRGKTDPRMDRQATRQFQKKDAVLKVECEVCSARYSIPMERIKGRILKIRCKNCSNIIKISGEEKSKSSVIDRGKKLWFVVISRKRIGPMTEQEVRERFERGEIKAKTYSWRRGFGKWERLRKIPEFEDLVHVARQEAAPSRPSATQALDSDLDRTERARPPRAEVEQSSSTNELDFDAPVRAATEAFEPPASRQPGITDPGVNTANFDGAGNEETTRAVKEAPRPGGGDDDSGAHTAYRTPPEELDRQATHIHMRQSAPDDGLADPELPDQAGAPPQDLSLQVDDRERVAMDRDARDKWDREFDGPRPAEEEEFQSPRIEDDRLSSGEWERHMKGQRRENSVLFSLSHLQELAHPVDEPVEKTGSSGNTGLLQIKAMSGPSAALLLPQDPAEGKQRGLGTVLAVAFLGVILGAGVLVGILYLIQPNLVKALLSGQEIAIADDSQEQAPPLAAKTAPDANKPVLLASAASLPDASSAPSVASNADAGIGARDAAVADEAVPGSQPPGVGEADRVAPAPRKRSRRKIRRRRRSRGGGITVEDPGPEDELDVAVRGDGAKKDDPAPETPAPTEPVKPPEPEKKDSKGPKDLDDLLDEATKGKLPAERGKKGDVPKDTPAPGATALPKSLSRAQVSAGMKRANPGVKMCYKQFKELGLVTIQATIDGGTGKITSARVVGGFANTPVGGCVLSAVKSRTYFPRFTGPPLTLKYPYMLR